MNKPELVYIKPSKRTTKLIKGLIAKMHPTLESLAKK